MSYRRIVLYNYGFILLSFDNKVPGSVHCEIMDRYEIQGEKKP
jgi:hypothetical protein